MTDQFISTLNTQSLGSQDHQNLFIPHIITSTQSQIIKKHVNTHNSNNKSEHIYKVRQVKFTPNSQSNKVSTNELRNQIQLFLDQPIPKDGINQVLTINSIDNEPVQQRQPKKLILSRDQSPLNGIRMNKQQQSSQNTNLQSHQQNKQPLNSPPIKHHRSHVNHKSLSHRVSQQQPSIQNDKSIQIQSLIANDRIQQQQQQNYQHFNHISQNKNAIPTINQNHIVSANQLYLNQKQAEQAAILGAQIIFNQYLKLHNKNTSSQGISVKERPNQTLQGDQNSKNISNFNQKQQKRDKLLPKKKALEKAKDQILQQVLQKDILTQDNSSHNSQFLPHIQQVKIVSSKIQQPTQNTILVQQQIPTVIGQNKGSLQKNTKHQKKKSLSQNEADNIMKSVNNNTHRNLITFIEEQKKYANDMIINIQSSSLIKSQQQQNHKYSKNLSIIGDHRDVKYAKSFINKIDMRDQDLILQQQQQLIVGNRFRQQLSQNNVKSIYQQNEMDYMDQSFYQEYDDEIKRQTIIFSEGGQVLQNQLSLPRINKPYIDKSNGELISARNSVFSEIVDNQSYFNVNQKKHNFIQEINTQPQNIFPEQSASSKALRSIDVIPFTNIKRHSNNISVQDYSQKSQSELQTINYNNISPNNNSKQLGLQDLFIHKNNLPQIKTGYENQNKMPALNTQRNNNRLNSLNTKSIQPKTPQEQKSEFMQIGTQSIENQTNKHKKFSQFHANIPAKNTNNLDDLSLSQQNSNQKTRNNDSSFMIAGFHKQKIQFQSPQDKCKRIGQNSLMNSIMIQSVALQTQQSQNILRESKLNQCSCNNNDKNQDFEQKQYNNVTKDLQIEEVKPRVLRELNVKIQQLSTRYDNQAKCKFCLGLSKSNRTPLGAYSMEFNNKNLRLKLLLNKNASNISISQIRECKDHIKQIFSQTKKLPASTPLKFEQTMRIGFSRRQNMENKPLMLLIFNDLIGVFESQYESLDKKNITHKFYIKKGLLNFMKEILQKFQVALFIDVRGKDKAQIIKEQLLTKEEMMFDGIYTYNNENNSKNSCLDIHQILKDFGVFSNFYLNKLTNTSYNLIVLQGIKYEKQTITHSKDSKDNIQMLDSLQQSQLQICTPSKEVQIQNIILGQNPYNFETLQKYIEGVEIQAYKQVTISTKNLSLDSNCIDLNSYYKQLNDKMEVLDFQAKQKLETIQPDLKISGLLSSLKTQNTYIAQEQRKYINYYKSKYKQVQETTNNLDIDLQESPQRESLTSSNVIYTNFHSKNQISFGNCQNAVKSNAQLDQNNNQQNNIEEHVGEQQTFQINEENEKIMKEYPKTIIIGERNNNVLDDYLLVEQKSAKPSCISVMDWLCKK